MKAGLLFYLSRRTSSCQRVLRRSAGYFGLEVPEARFCVKKEALGGALARLLRQYPMVFVVGSAQGKRPDCAGPIFNMLHVPPGPDGEPRGIMRLPGSEKTGYLVESATQAIILLPDDPYEILKMAKPMFQRLKRKFGLTGDFPKVEHPDYAKLIADYMEKAEHT